LWGRESRWKRKVKIEGDGEKWRDECNKSILHVCMKIE
jgi:hypothetical protein